MSVPWGYRLKPVTVLEARHQHVGVLAVRVVAGQRPQVLEAERLVERAGRLVALPDFELRRARAPAGERRETAREQRLPHALAAALRPHGEVLHVAEGPAVPRHLVDDDVAGDGGAGVARLRDEEPGRPELAL